MRKTNEIGIRKVLGASSANIVVEISAGFLKLVCIACLIAFPVSLMGMKSWIETYAFRINLSFMLFVLPMLVVIAIAGVFVGSQVLNVARAKVVNAIKADS